MGSWGTGPFDNDDAMDFFGELELADPDKAMTRVRDVLVATVERPGCLEVSEANVAVAAAALVAAGRSRFARSGSQVVDEWLSTHRPHASQDDQELAIRALDRVCGTDSEWLELWQTAGKEQDVRACVENLKRILSS
ncbi:hypothetical protein C3Y87_05365 [Carbonactinospora thermoautotrophica]|uniref:DUF4259 domain-containing protein n=1 Tax=Carbonactinospora thermoautotrophica TaxID=1469144 RepID=UPI00226DC09D|nr:DUF4259 domain-containing protein [Carbonactinospora thermoautotrophica]MCX9190849.1 hypothetical protein [Carbonactinospora thermoautotrophica]